MPLLVHPLIYTSFPKVGFQCLSSVAVPLDVQQCFLEKIVYEKWDTYNPPPDGYRAIYFHQISADQVILGWLYNDGSDDLGRSHIPYFIAYYFSGLLDGAQLENLLSCLELGPSFLINRQNPPKQIDSTVIPDYGRYQPVRYGLSIDKGTRQQLHRHLQQGRLLRLFIPLKMTEPTTFLNIPLENPKSIPNLNLNHVSTVLPPKSPLDQILEAFSQKPIGIQGVVLVSNEGQLMSYPMGIDEEKATIMAGRMLYLAQSMQDELDWPDIEHITIRGEQGHLILTRCDNNTFVLVKSGKGLTGLLEAEINRLVKQLKPTLDNLDRPLSVEVAESQAILPNLSEIERERETLYDLGIDLDDEDEVSYRGRKLG